MIGKALRKLDYRLAIIELLIIIGGTIVAGVFGGWRLAGVVGVLLFIFLDGLSCIWTIATHSSSERIQEKIDDEEKEKFLNKTKDNPSIR